MTQQVPLLTAPLHASDEINLSEIVTVLRENGWLISIVTAAALVVGTAYAFVATPVYRADALVQVDDSSSILNDKLGDLAAMFDGKATADAEIELIRSRQVVGDAVRQLHLDIDARPHYFPLVGEWIARRIAPGEARPPLGLKQFAWDGERISVEQFDVPASLYNATFTLVAQADETWRLLKDGDTVLTGKAGVIAHGAVQEGPLALKVSRIVAHGGTEFLLSRASTQQTVQNLQKVLDVKEKTKQSGIIAVMLDGVDSDLTTQTVNAIVHRYVQQNIDWKSAQAAQMLDFLSGQLPLIHAELDKAEQRYNEFRNRKRTVDLEAESRLLLQSIVDGKTRILALQQQRDELVQRFADGHPSVTAIDVQLADLRKQQQMLDAQVAALPDTQRTALGLERDVEINTQLYTKLMDSAQQLRVMRAGQQGNARIVDLAVVAEKAFWPRKGLVMATSFLLGLLLGVGGVFVRRSFRQGIETSVEIEQVTGIPVYTIISRSERQLKLQKSASSKERGMRVLAVDAPQDVAVEGIRSLRTALQFQMTRARNNIVMITGPRPAVGKSFLAINLAAVLAVANKRVLVIDADLRRGSMEDHFGVNRGPGLGDVLAGTAPDKVIRRNALPNLDILPRGVGTPNPAEALMGERFADAMKQFSNEYDIVIVDTPPVLAVTDSMLIGKHAGTTLLATRYGLHSASELRETVRLLGSAGVTICGITLGDVPPSATAYGTFSSYESVAP
ncbi:polysaccharide biosynthesis tyrosine autokinase [Paraburkholderia sp. CNPSo 3157]|uniref:Putative tyrosine-protein kinase EpsB n=1 Tax=Paraburkholderia franconis TaxID=2654983 RepID=A0A7X1NF68_9BURK|nr:polysaccharide biosynthesis tyrosine autokinase [Paraburkholderia franconis]